MDNFTQVRIARIIYDKFLQSSYKQDNPAVSLTTLINELFEDFLDGKVVKLTGNNYNEVKKCSDVLNKSNEQIVNMVLDKLELVPIQQQEKIKMPVDSDVIHRKIEVRKRVRYNVGQ